MNLCLTRSSLYSGLVLLLALNGCSSGQQESPSNVGGGKSPSPGTNVGGGGGGGGQSQVSAAGGIDAAQSGGGASAGESATSVGGGTSVASGDLLMDDFEDGDAKSLIGSPWYTYTDQDNGGGSTVKFTGANGASIAMGGEGYQSSKSLSAEFQFDKGTLTYDPYIGIGVSLGSASKPRDLSGYAGVSFSYKGAGHTLRIETTEVSDYDYFGVALPVTTSWKTVSLPFSLFRQEGWGAKVTFDPAHATAISFHTRGTAGNSNTLMVDNLKVIQALPEAKPDWVIQPPTPPADVVLDSLSITNPLQASAMKYLSRGVNITNWLEQARFDGFTYDEAYVQKLAKAGFKSLRLPIDLDLYVTETTGAGENLEVVVHDDLFEILDSFDTWTKENGISLTIDYHEYDKSLVLSDADSVNKAIRLWGKVAEHFATNPREDLFFELLNEPELSIGGTAPTQADWTALAEKMIASIRQYDTSHAILFGDVEWYGIGPLSKREPLNDDKVIYVFHDYDPFIFTHQGADWANMATTHDLPYPYSRERWTTYSSELGFTPYMESWILNDAKKYYQTGNRAALRNRIVDAKRWAVSHNVPVICNEFGAYDRTSRLEDRSRYYSDIVGIFDELEIPWQTWFTIMDAEGVVIPEYVQAMKLGQ